MEEALLSLRAGAEAAGPLRLCWEPYLPCSGTGEATAVLSGADELPGTGPALSENLGNRS